MQHANDNHTGLRFLSVCSGIEAASVAWHPLGWKAVAFSEIEKFPSAVLKHHYPDVPNLGDFTKIDTRTLGRVDILAGGTPCQAFSVAGLRQSLADARGNLSLDFVRLAHELAANNGLRNVVWENVVGVLSTKDNAFGCFLAGLVGADSAIEPPRRGKWARHGMVSGPKGRTAWAVKDGQFFGVAQRRRRVLVVADFGNGADPAAVLFEPESMFRDTPPSRETGKSITHPVAPSLVSSGRGIERTGDTRGQDPVVAVLRGHSDYGPGTPTLRAKGGDCAGGSEALVFAPEIARCDATREGSSQDYETTTMVAVGVTGDVAHTLKAEGADASEDGTGRGTPIVAFMENVRGELRTSDQTDSLTRGGGKPGQGYAAALVGSAVRRLTPVECERLQGFPDNYTDIPWRGKSNSPDGPRYKALGNSWAVPKFVWLGQRIQKLMPANSNQETPIANAA
ncbi:DNA cytosine methyltransferase [Agrobacterium sp. InxBP2]|uniref:DNA cytosine methyltransferase n=1 Tax=Agrobacterium sp. InxBP2 TaxID=2870329 RepID=UPI00249DD119|nr:DNA cytosine methyltransferase [Agrobacterium sp. InxBP2]MCW8279881.1 DNA cytosine methyltransferase [Agrobacterium sp. InxBP2]